MAKLHIQFLAKDSLEDGPSIEIESDIIPHIGEIIDAAEYLSIPSDLTPYYEVESVIYELSPSGFAAPPHQGTRVVRRKRSSLTYVRVLANSNDPTRSHCTEGIKVVAAWPPRGEKL